MSGTLSSIFNYGDKLKLIIKSKCKYKGCNEKSHHKYCKKHRCTLDKCYELAIIICDDKATFCVKHKCIVDECFMQRKKNMIHCSKHLCENFNCNNFSARKYCTKCECDVLNCNNIKKIINSYNDKKGCIEHTCKYDNCQRIKLDNSNYCIVHTCNHNSCYNFKEINFYCNEHKCKNYKCQELKYYNSGYCIIHKCKKCENCKLLKHYLCCKCEPLYCRVRNCQEQPLQCDEYWICQKHRNDYVCKHCQSYYIGKECNKC